MLRHLVTTFKITSAIAVSLILGWLAIRGLNWTDVRESLATTSLKLLILAITLFIAASYIRAARWYLLFPKHLVSLNRLFWIQNAGIGINNIVPIRVASEITQVALLSLRDGVHKSTSVAAIGMERILDLLSSTLILAIGFSIAPETRVFTPYVWAAFAATLILMSVIQLVSWRSNSIKFSGRLSFLSHLATSVRDLEQDKIRLLKSLTLSIIYWVIVGFTAWVVARAVDIPISLLGSTLVIMATISFSTLVPAAPSAIGTFEWAFIYVVGFFGIDQLTAFTYAIVVHTVFFLPPIIVAMTFLPREGAMTVSVVKNIFRKEAESNQ